MPNLDARIKDYVVGDAITVRRTIDRSASGMATGATVAKAWLTIKAAQADADPGLVQKAITTANVAGTGQIEDDGTDDADPVLRFDLTSTDTTTIGSTGRWYDIQVKLDDGTINTPESGQVRLKPQVTTTAT